MSSLNVLHATEINRFESLRGLLRIDPTIRYVFVAALTGDGNDPIYLRVSKAEALRALPKQGPCEARIRPDEPDALYIG